MILFSINKSLSGGLFLLLLACESEQIGNITPTYNRGGYTINRYQNLNLLKQDSAVILGKIQDVDDRTMIGGSVQLACIEQTATNGTYQLGIASVGSSKTSRFLRAISVGYLNVETEPFSIQTGNSIVVDFYLMQDEKPLINCEGSGLTP